MEIWAKGLWKALALRVVGSHIYIYIYMCVCVCVCLGRPCLGGKANRLVQLGEVGEVGEGRGNRG